MRDIIGDEYYKFQGFFEKAQEVAVYYGFTPIETPILEFESTFTTAIGDGTDVIDKEMYALKTKGGDALAMRPEGTAGVMRAYIENGMTNQPQPLLFYYYGPMFRHDKPQRGRYRQFYQFGLEAMGSEKSIIDALLIKATITILEEAGAKDLVVQINSMGDKEDRISYVKELTAYYKKHANGLSPLDQERLKTNPLRVLDSKDPATIEINQGAPDIVSHLGTPAKKHFKEVLECLDQMGISYQINKNLVRGLSYYTRTVFEIEEPSAEDGTALTIAAGGRYDLLARQLGSKKDVPSMGVGIGVDRIVETPWFKDLAPRIMKKPKVYFIQVGLDAKLKSLNVIEILRKAHIPVMQALSKDSLSAQLAVAEKSGVPYTIIFGQKEAMENSVIVRNMDTRGQDCIPVSELHTYLKSLK
ncbi:MAG: Histidine--tRNA ligase [Candidatus Nomurabacteria bacterium]|nr:Histidine--tRNA ligase [Candidatus Nomurabacteria bacterium]